MHYGTGADVFSFAIVMSELVTFSAPYAEHLLDQDGNRLASWDQIVAMTHKNGLYVSRSV